MANVVGQRVRRREDPRFLTGKGQYVDDLQPEGALHVTFVRSPWAHARITSVDKSAAEELPDTQVFTAADIELAVNPAPPFVGIDERMFRPFLASQKVRFAGDIVAVVLSGSRGSSVDAGDLVAVEYEPLPAVTDIEEAARDEVLLFEEMGTNVCLERPLEADEQLFDGCDVVTSGSIFSQRLAACPVEPRGTIAEFGDDGRLTVWLSTQTPGTDKMVLGLMLGLKQSNVRVVAPDVGGGFGGKGLADRGRADRLPRARPVTRCAGPRHAARTSWRCTRAARSGSASRSAARRTGSSRHCAGASSRTAARIRASARSSRT